MRNKRTATSPHSRLQTTGKEEIGEKDSTEKSRIVGKEKEMDGSGKSRRALWFITRRKWG